MREEIRKQSAELSEAALENVSGGVKFNDCLAKAIQLCGSCKACKKESELARYMQKGSNFSNIHNYKDCPFYSQ